MKPGLEIVVLLSLLLPLGGGAWAESRDALFDIDAKPETSATENSPATPATPATPAPSASAASPWNGYLQAEAARTVASPAHWSKQRLRLELGRQGSLTPELKWKLGARVDYDRAYDTLGYYAAAVRTDQRAEFSLRESYLDWSAGDWDFRFGRQHVVWGEMVGVFIADVVSVKDLREFFLPEFDALRIPQWAVRAEYFSADNHAEILWIPLPTVDAIGKPGAEFYPPQLPGPGGVLLRDEVKPGSKPSNGNYGLRLSTLRDGYDVSGFFYTGIDTTASFHRDILPGLAPVYAYTPRHERIAQAGGTLSKDLGWTLLKVEAVHTRGRSYSVLRPEQPEGLVRQDTLDYALGLDFTLPRATRLNLQLIQRLYRDHDPGILENPRETAASLLLESKLAPRLEGRLLLVASLNRRDWLLQPRLSWTLTPGWRLQTGLDIFHGPPTGLFGRYADRDRAYADLRYSF